MPHWCIYEVLLPTSATPTTRRLDIYSTYCSNTNQVPRRKHMSGHYPCRSNRTGSWIMYSLLAAALITPMTTAATQRTWRGSTDRWWSTPGNCDASGGTEGQASNTCSDKGANVNWVFGSAVPVAPSVSRLSSPTPLPAAPVHRFDLRGRFSSAVPTTAPPGHPHSCTHPAASAAYIARRDEASCQTATIVK